MELTYTKCGDYLIPNLVLSDTKEYHNQDRKRGRKPGHGGRYAGIRRRDRNQRYL